MTASDRPLRRVRVALDASRAGAALLAEAAALAARLGAELDALFVEDTALLHAAALPSAAQLASPSGLLRPVDLATIELELRAAGARARDVLDRARPGPLGWSFRVRRGSLAEEALRAAEEADLLLLACSGALGLAGVARAAAARAPVLVPAARGGLGPPLAVAWEGPISERALRTVGALAQATGGALVLVVSAPTAADAERLASAAREQCGWRGPVTVRWAGAGKLDLERLLAEARGPVLVASWP